MSASSPWLELFRKQRAMDKRKKRSADSNSRSSAGGYQQHRAIVA